MEKGAESILAENFLFPQPASAAPAVASAYPRNGEVLLARYRSQIIAKPPSSPAAGFRKKENFY